MAGVSRTTEAKDLDSSKGKVEAEPGTDGDLGGGDATASEEALSHELDRDEREAAGDVEDGAQETVKVGETLGRSHSDLKRLARWPKPYRLPASPTCTRST
jgi:hypothetical protein